MPVGTSDGEYFDDHYDYVSRRPVINPDTDLRFITNDQNVVTPQEVETNKQMDKIEQDPSTGTGIPIGLKRVEITGGTIDSGMPPEASTEPTGALKSGEGGETPGKDTETKNGVSDTSNFFQRLSIMNALRGMMNPDTEGDINFLKQAWGALKLPGDVAKGEIDPSSPEAIGKAFDLAGMVALAPVAGLTTREATLGTGVVKPKPSLKEGLYLDEHGSPIYDGKGHPVMKEDVPGTPEFDQKYGYKPYYPDPKQFEQVPLSETAKAMREIEKILNFWENESSVAKTGAKKIPITEGKGEPTWMPPPPKDVDKLPPKEAFKQGAQEIAALFKTQMAEIGNKLRNALASPPEAPPGPRVSPVGDYTHPAYRGLTIPDPKGQVSPIYDFTKGGEGRLYSTSNPMLADMYAGYLDKHPGIHVPEGTFPDTAQVMPLMINVKDYHYYDAKGAKWQVANKKAIEEAGKMNKKGVIVDNVFDEPNSTTALGKPNRVYITFPHGAGTVKSRFAERFDESSPNILHGIGTIGIGTAATGYVSFGTDSQE